MWWRGDSEATPNVVVTRGQDAFLQTLGVSWDATADAVATVTSTYMVNRVAEGQAFTAATGDQGFTPILPNMQVSLDDDWATMVGTTPTFEADVYSCEISLTTGLAAVMRGHGNAAYGYDLVDRASVPLMTMTLGVYVDALATGVHREQRAIKAAGGRVFAALHGVGEQISAGPPVVNHAVSIGGCFTHMPESLVSRGTYDADGRETMTIQLQSMYDPTSTVEHNFYVRAQNTTATY